MILSLALVANSCSARPTPSPHGASQGKVHAEKRWLVSSGYYVTPTPSLMARAKTPSGG